MLVKTEIDSLVRNAVLTKSVLCTEDKKVASHRRYQENAVQHSGALDGPRIPDGAAAAMEAPSVKDTATVQRDAGGAAPLGVVEPAGALAELQPQVCPA